MGHTTGHYRNECEHGTAAGQCRCPSKDKPVYIVPCPAHCTVRMAERFKPNYRCYDTKPHPQHRWDGGGDDVPLGRRLICPGVKEDEEQPEGPRIGDFYQSLLDSYEAQGKHLAETTDEYDKVVAGLRESLRAAESARDALAQAAGEDWPLIDTLWQTIANLRDENARLAREILRVREAPSLDAHIRQEDTASGAPRKPWPPTDLPIKDWPANKERPACRVLVYGRGPVEPETEFMP